MWHPQRKYASQLATQLLLPCRPALNSSARPAVLVFKYPRWILCHSLHFMLLRHPCLNQPQQDWVTRSLCFTEKGYTRLACGREIWSMARKLCVLGVKALWETTDMDTAIIPLRKHRRHVWIRTCCALNSSTSIWLLIYCTKKVANNTLIVKMYTYYMQRQDNAQMSIYKEDGHL